MTIELRVPVEGELHDKVAAVLQALYTWSSRGHESGSYASVELPKIELADAVLRALGLPDEPVEIPPMADESTGERARSRRRALIPLVVRARIIARDRFRCVKCRTDVDLTIDHIVPVVAGGTDDEANLQTLCRSCNSSKGARVA